MVVVTSSSRRDDVRVEVARELEQEPVDQTQAAQQGLPVVGFGLGPQDFFFFF